MQLGVMQLEQTQHVLRSFLRGLPHLIVGGVPKERAGEKRLAYRRLGVVPTGDIRLTSAAFGHGEPIPTRYTADGRSDEPPLQWSGVPAQAQSLALIVEDPDAPTPQPFVHWLLYGIPAGATSTDQAHALGAKVGKNSMLKAAWGGCAPPKGDVAHRYVFQLFVLDRHLELQPRVGRSTLLFAMGGHLLGCATLIGTYKR
jgi:Raf kinase inhibitor-like YbhB/YbcL family protein